MDNKIYDELGLVFKDGKVLISSRKVAEIYQKRHSDVMRDIRNILTYIPESQDCNFIKNYYIDKKNEKRPEYLMDKHGFIILTSRFTGGKALRLNKTILDLFNEMEVNLLYKVRDEYVFSELLQKSLQGICKIIPQYQVDNYKIDFYIPEINLAIEYDEEHHQYQQQEDEIREKYIKRALQCDFIRVKKGEELDGLNNILKYIINVKNCDLMNKIKY